MFNRFARASALTAPRFLRPYADVLAFARAAARENWDERDRDSWLWRGSSHARLTAAAVALFASGVIWQARDATIAERQAASHVEVALVPEEIAPAAAPATAVLPEEDRRRFELIDLADQRLRMLERRLDLSETERQRLESEFQRLQSDVAIRKREMADREQQMSDLVAGQSAALGRLAEQTSASVEALSKLVARTGIDPERLIAAVRRDVGIGGPYIQLAENHYVAPDVVAPGLGGPMLRLEALRRALTALPLETPLSEFGILSPFGVRRDPFNGHAAMHYGMDLSAPSRTAIHATAPGTVVTAGWQGDYGNLVEIDHGFGIRTRYAHLSRVDVKIGDAVHARARLGLVGTTGRSTGPHLHYEVVFEGDNLDPMRFIEAKRFVLRGEGSRRGSRG